LFGFGGGGGRVFAAGESIVSLTGYGSASADFEGSGSLFQGYVFFESPVSSHVSFIPLAGFRYAKIPEAKMAGEFLYNQDGSKLSIDYSGLFVAASFRIRMGTQDPTSGDRGM